MLYDAMEYRFSITDVLSSKVVIGRWPYAHGPILRQLIATLHRREKPRLISFRPGSEPPIELALSFKSDAAPCQAEAKAAAFVCGGGACAPEPRGAPDVLRFRRLCGRPARLDATRSRQVCQRQWRLDRSFGRYRSGRSGASPGVPFSPPD